MANRGECCVISCHAQLLLGCDMETNWIRSWESSNPKSVFPTKSYLCDSLPCQMLTPWLLFETSMKYTSLGQSCIFFCETLCFMYKTQSTTHCLMSFWGTLWNGNVWAQLAKTWVFLVLVTSQGRSDDISSHRKHQTLWPQPVFCTF